MSKRSITHIMTTPARMKYIVHINKPNDLTHWCARRVTNHYDITRSLRSSDMNYDNVYLLFTTAEDTYMP